jgi:hypothetical protein
LFSPDVAKIVHRYAAERIAVKFLEQHSCENIYCLPFLLHDTGSDINERPGNDIELPTMLANIAHNACGE